MEHILIVKEIIGSDFTCQDAILLKSYIKQNLNETVVLDFSGLNTVPTTFFYTLLSDIFSENNREYLFDHIKVKNLSNPQDFKMVVLGMPHILC